MSFFNLLYSKKKYSFLLKVAENIFFIKGQTNDRKFTRTAQKTHRNRNQ